MFSKKKKMLFIVLFLGVLFLSIRIGTVGASHLLAHAPELPW